MLESRTKLLPPSISSFFILIAILLWFFGLMRAFALVSLVEVILLSWVIFHIYGQIRAGQFQLSGQAYILMIGIALWFLILTASATLTPDFFGSGAEEIFSWRKVATSFAVAYIMFAHTKRNSILRSFFYFSLSMSFVLVLFKFFELPTKRPIQAIIENHTTQPILLVFLFLPYFWKVINDPSLGILHNIFYWLALMLQVLGTFYVSDGRGGYLYFIVVTSALGYFYFCRISLFLKLKEKLILLAVFGCITLIIWFFIESRVLQADYEFVLAYDPSFDSKGASVSIRRHMWMITLEIIRDNWLTGTGAGQFANEYSLRVSHLSGWLARPTDDPHNSYLLTAAEHGLPALIFLLSFTSAILLRSIKVSESREAQAFGVLALGFLFTSLTSGHFNTFVEGRLFFFSLFYGLFCSTRFQFYQKRHT